MIDLIGINTCVGDHFLCHAPGYVGAGYNCFRGLRFILHQTDAGIGALKAEFVREVRIETTEGERIFLQYDFLSERIVQICLGSVDSAREWNYGLGAELIGALSDDNRKSEEKRISEVPV